ncbi:phosphoribosylformylglycinamidine synthase subunit PurQ [Chloroflexota bacterium]
MNFGVIVFPGTWSDRDCHHVLGAVMGQEVDYVWYRDTDLRSYDCVVLPGGFSYGDYLRPGAIARFAPVMTAVERFAAQGKLVIGICNGFQVLCEAGLLPGALIRNSHLQFRCQWTDLRVENAELPFTCLAQRGQVLRIPISHYEGSYYADSDVLDSLEGNGRVVFRYSTPSGEITAAANPNGSLNNIAGICNSGGNVLGMMPHPERCCEDEVGGRDGLVPFQSLMEWASRGRTSALPV